jgi:hypothetical protein
MPVNGTSREGDWTRLVVPVAVLVASVAACSVMPPAGASARAPVCHPDRAEAVVGRAASAPIVEQARLASGSDRVRLVMPGEPHPQAEHLDRLVLHLDERSLITRATCG